MVDQDERQPRQLEPGPFGARVDEVLEKRARALAATPERNAERRRLATVALVGVGGEVFGVPVGGLREIVRAPPVAPLPGLPDWLPGIVQFRGEVLSVVDLGRWFGVETETAAGYLVVLSGFKSALGLLVGSVLGFRDIYEDEVAAGLGDRARPLLATTRDLVCVLDLPALSRSDDLRVATGPRNA
ncbi:MAG: chemotaxis protein CheW [Myxococcales bacterium]